MTVSWKVGTAALCLLLAGCASPDLAEPGEAALTEDFEGALPVHTQLIVGTLRLEEGEAGVTADQATELIPLWRAVRSLSTSDTAAEAEVEALLDQIQESMTAEQLQAITAMRLTQEDLLETMQQLGIGPGGDGPGFASSSEPGEAQAGPLGGPEFQFEGAPPQGFQQGGPGGGGPGGGGPGGVENLDPAAIATLQAQRGGQLPVTGRTGLLLIDPLLEYLEAKAGS